MTRRLPHGVEPQHVVLLPLQVRLSRRCHVSDFCRSSCCNRWIAGRAYRPVARRALNAALAASVFSAAALPVQLGAQEAAAESPTGAALATATTSPDSILPFRRGQWAARFRLSSDAIGLGALRFRSNSSAFLLDGRVFAVRESSGDAMSGFERVGIDVTLSAGLRAYRPVVARVARYHGAGLRTAYSRSDVEPTDYLSWRVLGGLYGELGATYFVTPHLSLDAGTEAGVNLSRGRDRRGALPGVPDSERRTSGIVAWAGGIIVTGTLYF